MVAAVRLGQAAKLEVPGSSQHRHQHRGERDQGSATSTGHRPSSGAMVGSEATSQDPDLAEHAPPVEQHPDLAAGADLGLHGEDQQERGRRRDPKAACLAPEGCLAGHPAGGDRRRAAPRREGLADQDFVLDGTARWWRPCCWCCSAWRHRARGRYRRADEGAPKEQFALQPAPWCRTRLRHDQRLGDRVPSRPPGSWLPPVPGGGPPWP
jgi:hypothetical protein